MQFGKRVKFTAFSPDTPWWSSTVTSAAVGTKFGLSVDHIVDAQIVDANESLLDRKSMGEGLSLAIRGGGSRSGIVVSYKVKLIEVLETDPPSSAAL
ncbi:unnamed protein product [Linum tenue]|uniref:Uncharacterized protein n=1 Tax=Linum tenue TaxID=586396 RepID=A0AAV0MI25_9ROSI|nr:unnamed protein product [Linum tenue]